MNWVKGLIEITTQGKGLYPFTHEVTARINKWGIQEGMCFLYMPHTSASFVINESYDPSARIDMEEFMERLVPENQPWFKHILEGPDDSTSHIRALLTQTSLSIPIDDGKLSLGRWQGVYLFEHRRRAHNRRVQIRCLGIE